MQKLFSYGTLQQEKVMSDLLPCLCCGYKTIENRAEWDICPVCFWEDEPFIIMSILQNEKRLVTAYDNGDPDIEQILDISSGANHGLTLREARANYTKFGACEKAMIEHVRPPRENEE